MKQLKPQRRRPKAGKGSGFERAICKQLSLWWTDGERDDIFWRTSGSGARAKVRGKKQTFGQYGDVQATDPIGQPLIDRFTIEIKRGYNDATLSDFLDQIRKKGGTKPLLQKFMEQVMEDCRLRDDGSEWILLVKRDYKEVVLFTPAKAWKALSVIDNFYSKNAPSWRSAIAHIPIFRMRLHIGTEWKIIMAMRFRDFLEYVNPKVVKSL